jgi:hypothetical protein
MRAAAPLGLLVAALMGCGGDGGAGGSFAERANAICEEHNPRLFELLVQGVAGDRVTRERLERFWERYPAELREQLDELEALDGAGPAATAYLERLARNVAGFEDVRDALEAGRDTPSSEQVWNSEVEANQLAEDARLPSCSPAEHIHPASRAAYLVG